MCTHVYLYIILKISKFKSIVYTLCYIFNQFIHLNTQKMISIISFLSFFVDKYFLESPKPFTIKRYGLLTYLIG